MTSPQDKSSTPATSSAAEPAANNEPQREAEASRLVERFTLWSGAAALVPVPLIDIAAVGGLQIEMVRRLSHIYGVPFAENRGKSIIASIAGSLLPASAASTTTVGALSMLKFLPGFGLTIAVIAMPAFSACATFVIGRVFIKHFASGGTLLDFDLPTYREFIDAQKAKFRSRRASPATPPGEQTATEKPAAATKP